MTFLELQKKILQTRKARKGVHNRTDYFSYPSDSEDFYNAVYKKALKAANDVIKHYDELGEIDAREKITVTFGKEEKKKRVRIPI